MSLHYNGNDLPELVFTSIQERVILLHIKTKNIQKIFP
jgi:hypothetical protein